MSRSSPRLQEQHGCGQSEAPQAMTNERRSATPSLLAPRRKGSAARDGYTTRTARGVEGSRCRSRKDLNLGLGPIRLAERDSTDFAFINTIPPAVGSLCFRIRTGERHRSCARSSKPMAAFQTCPAVSLTLHQRRSNNRSQQLDSTSGSRHQGGVPWVASCACFQSLRSACS
jgi:hypothetical protein